MSKVMKICLSLAVAAGVFLVITLPAFADAQIDDYVKNYGFDLLGWHGENLYFTLRDQYAQGNPFKVVYYDITHIADDAKVVFKTLNDNDIIYIFTGGSGWLMKLGKAGKALDLLKLLKPY